MEQRKIYVAFCLFALFFLFAESYCAKINLHYAAEVGSIEVVEDFLTVGALVNGVDGHGRTALHYAAMYGHEKVAALLLKQIGVEKNCKDSLGLTPLIYAKGGDHTGVVKLLQQETGNRN